MGGPKHTGCRSATQKYKDRIAMAEKPYDRLEGVIWYDGKLVPWGEATLHVLSHGLHYASSVFEGERAYGGEIFKCTEHSQRLKRSAELLDFDIPYSVADIDAAKRLVLEKNGQSDAYVRPVSWRGSEMMGVSAQNNKIHLAIATWQWPSYFDPVQRLKGIRLALADYRRPDPATAPGRIFSSSSTERSIRRSLIASSMASRAVPSWIWRAGAASKWSNAASCRM